MSSGEIVDINEDKIINLDSMHTEIKDTIAYTRSFADGMQVTLAAAIRDLQEVVGAYNPDIIAVDTSISALDRPVFPTIPIFTDYSSDIRDALISRVQEGLVEGGTGISEAVYAAIIEREKETRRANQDTVYRQFLDSVGSRGFNLPSGQVGSLQAKIATEIIKADQDSLNNVLIKDFELSQKNSEFILNTAIELEKTLVGTWAQIENVKVSVYNSEIQGVIGQYDALAKWADSEISRIKVESDIAIKNGELSLAAYTAMSSLAEKVAAEIGGIATQSIASALGAINTSLSNSYSGSEGRSEKWGHSESLGEYHSYSG